MNTIGSVPVWLLDVDGVLNANRPSWGAAPRQGLVYADGIAWKFRWSPAVIGFVREVAHVGKVEIRWSTSWVRWSDSVEKCFALPSLPLAFNADTPDVTQAKIDAALSVVENERRPLIWTDDEVVPTSGVLRERLEAPAAASLLIRPLPKRGLQPEHVELIRAFAHL
jgi:hypothetical protein